MEYVSLILSLIVIYFVLNLTFRQKRFDLLNGALIVGALTVVALDVDTLITKNKHWGVGFISLGVLLLWFISMRRKPKGSGHNQPES